MFMHKLATHIMSSPVNAIISLSLMACLSYFGFFHILLTPTMAGITLITLRRGAASGLKIILAVSSISILVSTLLFNSPNIAITLSLFFWIPVWLLAITLRRTVSLSKTVSMAILIGITILAAIYINQGDMLPFWKKVFSTDLKPYLLNGNINPKDLSIFINHFSKIMTSSLISLWLIIIFSALLLGRWWQALLFNPGEFKKEFINLKINPSIGLILSLLIVFCFFSEGNIQRIGIEFIIVAIGFYLFQGIALIHNIAHAYNAHTAWLIAFYLLLIIAMNKLLLLLIGIGYSDTWINFRKYIKPQQKG